MNVICGISYVQESWLLLVRRERAPCVSELGGLPGSQALGIWLRESTELPAPSLLGAAPDHPLEQDRASTSLRPCSSSIRLGSAGGSSSHLSQDCQWLNPDCLPPRWLPCHPPSFPGWPWTEGQAREKGIVEELLTLLCSSVHSTMSTSSAPRSLCTWPASPP